MSTGWTRVLNPLLAWGRLTFHYDYTGGRYAWGDGAAAWPVTLENLGPALVCPLLPDPAGAAVYGACPHARPAGESVTHPSSSTAAFGDPPGITGDGAPSWGPYPANGLIIHHPPTANPGADTGYIETCTLPEADHALCTAALNDFLRRYE